MSSAKNGKQKHSLGAFAIIPNHIGDVLLCHRTDFDAWNLPGGAVEHGESPWAGVVREVKEETGLFVSVDSLLGVYFKPGKNEVVFSFLCRIIEGSPKTTDEADELAYFSPSALPVNLLAKQKERIQDWATNQSIVIMKEQNSY